MIWTSIFFFLISERRAINSSASRIFLETWKVSSGGSCTDFIPNSIWRGILRVRTGGCSSFCEFPQCRNKLALSRRMSAFFSLSCGRRFGTAPRCWYRILLRISRMLRKPKGSRAAASITIILKGERGGGNNDRQQTILPSFALLQYERICFFIREEFY